MRNSPVYRFALIIAAALVFVGLIIYSSVKVRHPVDGKSKTEYFVTEQSLTHNVVRGKDGALKTPGGTGDTRPGQGRACPT